MTSAAGGAVCCMCGDHGLADELFRCRCCRARLQHRYCSDLYPRAPAYRRCNWCLRASAAAAGADSNRPEEKRKTSSTASDEDHQHQGGCSPSPRRRSRSPTGHHPHPVKKKHRAAAEEKTTPQPAAEKEAVVSTGAGGGSKDEGAMMRPGTKARLNRVRARRYRLLAEVITC